MALRARENAARIVCAVLVACVAAGDRGEAQNGGLIRMFGGRHYEYDERLDLSIDGSATIDVNASIPALVALHGVKLDVNPEARFDRQSIRQLFDGAGGTVREISAFRRDGRRFAHVRLEVSDIRRLSKIAALSWSRYQFERLDREYRFLQDVGPPARGQVGEVGWTGDELVAFRLHLPSKIDFHNSPNDIERGNILAWEQTLGDRLAGTPLHMEARMETQSILYRTLWLFGGTFLSAMAVLALTIWWVRRKGRSAI